MSNMEEPITSPQFKAIHVFFEKVAKLCREEGISREAIIIMMKKHSMEVPVTLHFIKEYWKAVEKDMFGKTSTTQHNKDKEIDEIYVSFVKCFGEEFGVELPKFPTNCNLCNAKWYEKHSKNCSNELY